MGNCSPKTLEYESPPGNDVWYIDRPSILPEPLETEYMKRPEYEPIWLRPLPASLEPLKPLNESKELEFPQEKFKGKLAPLKLC